jgi:hypothetical protein
MNLNKCSTVGEMITEVKKNYSTETTPVGPLTKKMLIVGLKGAIKLSPPLEKALLDCHTFGMMLDAVKLEHDVLQTTIEEKHKNKIIAGINSAITMTRCKKK